MVSFSQVENFKIWLEKPDNYRQLKKIAAGIRRRMELKGLFLPGVDLRLSGDFTEDICQELVSYLLTAPGIQKDLVGGAPNILTRINNFFFNHLIDLNRGKNDNQDIYKDTWRLFYRHVRDVLASSNKFIKFKSLNHGISFAMTDNKPAAIILPEDLLSVEFPCDMPTHFEALNKKKHILKLASYYWNKCRDITKEPGIRIGVRDFVSWIGQYVQLQVRIDSQWRSLPEKHFSNIAASPAPDLMKKDYLKTWAGNFYHLLRKNEKTIFYYFECLGLKGTEVSKQMGKKANLSYQRGKLHHKLKEFLMPLEWISPEPGSKGDTPDLEAFRFFRSELCKQLNNSETGP